MSERNFEKYIRPVLTNTYVTMQNLSPSIFNTKPIRLSLQKGERNIEVRRWVFIKRYMTWLVKHLLLPQQQILSCICICIGFCIPCKTIRHCQSIWTGFVLGRYSNLFPLVPTVAHNFLIAYSTPTVQYGKTIDQFHVIISNLFHWFWKGLKKSFGKFFLATKAFGDIILKYANTQK